MAEGGYAGWGRQESIAGGGGLVEEGHGGFVVGKWYLEGGGGEWGIGGVVGEG